MQRKYLAGVPLLVIALIFLAFWLVNKRVTPAWRAQLNLYLAFKVTPPEAPIQVLKTAHANLPWLFTADMSGATYGDCLYFEVTYCINHKGSLSDPPLTYPVEDIWCALLQTASPSLENRWIVYIAKHEALYNTDWIVHESSTSISNPQLSKNLSQIGCDGLLEPTR